MVGEVEAPAKPNSHANTHTVNNKPKSKKVTSAPVNKSVLKK